MRLFKKLTSFVMSAVVAAACIGIPGVSVYAKGADTLLYEMYSDKPDATSPTEIYQCSAGGINSTRWQYFSYTDGTKYGYDKSAGNVVYCLINISKDDIWGGTDEMAAETHIAGREYVSMGTYLLWHTNGRWNAYTVSLNDYKDTATVTANVSFAKASYIKDAYLYMRSTSNGIYSYTAVKLSDKYLTESDEGRAVRVSIPLSEFLGNNNENYIINDGFNPAYFSSMGIMLVNPTSEEKGYIAFDDMRICNVEAPKNFVVTKSTDTTAEFIWDESASDIDHYNVYRNGEKIGETSDTKYSDTSLAPGGTYEYSICAVDKYGAMSPMTESVSVYASYIGAPQNFAAESSFADSLRAHLTWEVPEYGTALGYEVYRDGRIIAETDANTLMYDDKYEDTLSENTFHTYYVKAKSSMDSSMPTDSISVLITFIGYPVHVSVTEDNGSAVIEWSEIASADRYDIYRNSECIATVEKDTLKYIDTTREYSKAYTYYLCAVNESGKSSLPSQKITNIKYEPQKKFEDIFTDSAADNYSLNSIGMSKASTNETTYAIGKRSVCVNIAGGSFDYEGAAFTTVNPIDVTTRRANGGRLEFFVYADEPEKLKNVKVALGSLSDKLSDKTYTVRTSVNLADYIENYGNWSYVSIPLGDFPATGTYSAFLGTNRPAPAKFDKITEIDIYTDTAHYYSENVIYADDVKFADFDSPKLVSASLSDGTQITNGDKISAKTSQIDMKFDTPIDTESLAGCASVNSAESVISAGAAPTESADTIRVTFESALKADTTYTVKLSGLRSANGTAIPDVTFDILTDSESQAPTEMADTEYVTFDSVNVTRGKNTKIRLALGSGNAKSTPVSALDVTVKYDSDILGVSGKDSVSLAGALKNAEVTVDKNNGTINIKIDKDTLSYTIGSYIADITFSAIRAGSSDIAVSGTLTQAAPEKTVTVTQNSIPRVVVTTYTESSHSGSSGGGSFGGGRSEGTAKPNGSVTVTDNTIGGNSSKRIFADSAEVLWAEKAIEELGKEGKINGYEDGTFKPLKEVTREEFVSMIIRALSEVDETAVSDLSDVDSSEWYAPAVATAQKLGITEGMGGTFGVGELITRQDMCTMLTRAANVCKISLSSNYNTVLFADFESVADYAKESVSALQRAGIINGVEENRFAPTENVNRAMAAKVIYMLSQLK